MRMMRYLLAVALVCGLAGAAKGDDFRMVVLDPPGQLSYVSHLRLTVHLFPLRLALWDNCLQVLWARMMAASLASIGLARTGRA